MLLTQQISVHMRLSVILQINDSHSASASASNKNFKSERHSCFSDFRDFFRVFDHSQFSHSFQSIPQDARSRRARPDSCLSNYKDIIAAINHLDLMKLCNRLEHWTRRKYYYLLLMYVSSRKRIQRHRNSFCFFRYASLSELAAVRGDICEEKLYSKKKVTTYFRMSNCQLDFLIVNEVVAITKLSKNQYDQ